MIRRAAFVLVACASLFGASAGAAFACGGLVAPGHAEVLEKATTLAAWHDGLEHYVTGFRFAGAGVRFRLANRQSGHEAGGKFSESGSQDFGR